MSILGPEHLSHWKRGSLQDCHLYFPSICKSDGVFLNILFWSLFKYTCCSHSAVIVAVLNWARDMPDALVPHWYWISTKLILWEWGAS